MRQTPTRHQRRSEHAHDVYHIVLVTKGAHFSTWMALLAQPNAEICTSSAPDSRTAFEAGPDDTTEYCEVTMQFVTRKGRSVDGSICRTDRTLAGLPQKTPATRQTPPELYALIIREVGQTVQERLQVAAIDTPLRVNRSLGDSVSGVAHRLVLGRRSMGCQARRWEQAYQHIQAHFNGSISAGRPCGDHASFRKLSLTGVQTGAMG